jgi:hypothetical protein
MGGNEWTIYSHTLINNVVPYFKYISIPAGVLDALRLFVWYAYNGMLDCRALDIFETRMKH